MHRMFNRYQNFKKEGHDESKDKTLDNAKRILADYHVSLYYNMMLIDFADNTKLEMLDSEFSITYMIDKI